MRAISDDLTGRRFGRWVALHQSRLGKRRGWLCVCDCGTERVVLTFNLCSGGSTSCGCQRKEAVADIGRGNRVTGRVSYIAAHMRVRRAKGPASSFPCVDCEAPAREWSYDHTDPNQWYEPNRRNGRLMAYSGDLVHYVPRCKACHVSFDKRRDGQAQH